MAAGEGIFLGGDVEDIRVLPHRFETLDLRRVKIRPAAENGAFDHGIQHQGEERVHAHEAAEALVIAPVEEAEHRHAGQLLTEGGDKRSQRGPKAAHMCLQPDDQVNLPLEEKSIAGQFHIIDLPYKMPCYYSAFRRRSRVGFPECQQERSEKACACTPVRRVSRPRQSCPQRRSIPSATAQAAPGSRPREGPRTGWHCGTAP